MSLELILWIIAGLIGFSVFWFIVYFLNYGIIAVIGGIICDLSKIAELMKRRL